MLRLKMAFMEGDSQVCFLESVVSIHDKGVWVGDIDVLAAMKAPNVIRLRPWTPCSHAPVLRPARNLISIECWDEILKPPRETSIIRANGNWVARLAIKAVMATHTHDALQSQARVDQGLVICPSSVCWACEDPAVPFGALYPLHQLPRVRRVYLY